MKTEAVLLWAGLVILAVVLLGLGLMWGVARGGRLLMRQRKSKPMDTRDIWFLNPPEKKRPPRGDDELHDTDEIEDLP